LVSEIDYTDGGAGYLPSTKTEYSYTGNTLLRENFYSYDNATSIFDLDETDTYEYDSKINPLLFCIRIRGAEFGSILFVKQYYQNHSNSC
jgi:hypothetical protein